ncbi:MAG: ArsR/SmtB family transcription factor [Planctomycetota bacterium]
MVERKTRVDCASRLKVLADPTRLQVLRELLGGACHVGTLLGRLRIEQSLLSHHLRALRDAGLVDAERDGKAVLYRLAPNVDVDQQGTGIDLGCCQLSFPRGS